MLVTSFSAFDPHVGVIPIAQHAKMSQDPLVARSYKLAATHQLMLPQAQWHFDLCSPNFFGVGQGTNWRPWRRSRHWPLPAAEYSHPQGPSNIFQGSGETFDSTRNEKPLLQVPRQSRCRPMALLVSATMFPSGANRKGPEHAHFQNRFKGPNMPRETSSRSHAPFLHTRVARHETSATTHTHGNNDRIPVSDTWTMPKVCQHTSNQNYINIIFKVASNPIATLTGPVEIEMGPSQDGQWAHRRAYSVNCVEPDGSNWSQVAQIQSACHSGWEWHPNQSNLIRPRPAARLVTNKASYI